MAQALITFVLLSSIVAFVYFYLLLFVLAYFDVKKGNLQSDSKGIKNLKFQEYNPAWQRYVTHK